MTDIAYEVEGAVALATFDRPEVLNAFRRATVDALHAVLDAVERDEAVRVLVLTGRGRAFCAGEDLEEFGEFLRGDPTPDALAAQVAKLQDLTRRLAAARPVTLAAVNGHAVGMGAELGLACDLRLAAEDARFSFPEVRRGLIPTNGAFFLLPRLVGTARARLWLLTGREVSAEEAREAGLVAEVVPSARLRDAALETAGALARTSRAAATLIKEALGRSHALDLEGSLRLETEATLACFESGDQVEGVRSFLERREPDYRTDA